MFGVFRYVLASMVVLTHLWPAQSMWWGIYAVFSFYLVSGYLMTLVLDQTYPYNSDGLRRFMLSRVLRIYPPYLVLCVVALMLIATVPDAASSANFKMQLPDTPQRWLANVFIFGLLGDKVALVPPAWSLNIELVFYIAMAALLARHRLVITPWFVVSVAYTLYLLSTEVKFKPRYNEILGASLPFAVGAMLYAWRTQLLWIRGWTAWISGTLFLANAALAAYWPIADRRVHHFYLSLFFAALLLVTLTRLRPADLPNWYVKLDRIGGNLSYPIFLCHFHVAAIVVWLGFDSVRPKDSFAFWATSFVLSNLLAWAIYEGVDRNSDRLRDRIRRQRSSRDVAHDIPPSKAT